MKTRTRHNPFNIPLTREQGPFSRLFSKLQLGLGIVAAALVLVMAIQAGDFGLVKDQMSLIKSFARWNEIGLTK